MTRYRISIWVAEAWRGWRGEERQSVGVVCLWYPTKHSLLPAVLPNLFPLPYLAPSEAPFSIINQITKLYFPVLLNFSLLRFILTAVLKVLIVYAYLVLSLLALFSLSFPSLLVRSLPLSFFPCACKCGWNIIEWKGKTCHLETEASG